MSTSEHNGWETFDPEDAYAGTSLKKRAEKRTVQQTDEYDWIVHGNPKLGDAYPNYYITLPKGELKYVCSCYSHGRGEYRKRRMCSHVLAVILFRKNTDKNQDDEPEPLQPRQASFHNTEPAEPEKAAVDDQIRNARAATRRDDGEGSERFKSVAADTLPDDPMLLDDDAFGSPPLPDKFTEYRDNQWEAIVEIMEHLEDGRKVVMLSAPVGSGKTLIGETVRRLMAGKTVYNCTTKTLQDQIQREFEYARTIKGRANYPTQLRKDLTAEDCTGTSSNGFVCKWCEQDTVGDSRPSCPYRIAKEDAWWAPLPILNIAYFLAETSVEGSMFCGRELVIIDEADTLEQQLMSSIEVVIGSRLRKSIGVTTLPKKTIADDWARWLVDEVVPAIKLRQGQLRQESMTLFGEGIEQKRQVGRLGRLLDRIKSLVETADDGSRRIDEGWVMTGYEGDVKDPTIMFKPVHVDLHAREALWDRGKQFLLMSATLISPAQMADDLGLEDDEWSVVHVGSTFPIENRPVFVNSVAPMTNKTKARSWPIMAEAIENLLNKNPDVRILVHTVSYHLTQYLYDNIKSSRTMTYQSARDRENTLEDFLDKDNAVLLAPSFERGIDLPEEDCQIIVIAKVPFPYLGNKQVSARLYERGGKGQIWYSVETIRSIVQMTGRGMRSKDDWCDTYILDTTFKRLYRENKRLFPKWWRESLVLSMSDPKNKKLIKAARKRRESR